MSLEGNLGENIEETVDVEIDVARSFVMPGDAEQDKNSTTYLNESMDIANESLIYANIEQTVQGNLKDVKRKLEVEIDNCISFYGTGLPEELDVVNGSRFVVSVDKLKELKGAHCAHLLEAGTVCGAKLNFATSQMASVCILSWNCINKHFGSWTSSEVLCYNRYSPVYVNDMMLSSCILLSGNNFSKINLFFKFLNLHMPGDSTFCRIQRLFCLPEITNLWNNMQGTVSSTLKEYNDICLCGDGRNDSPGHSARYCCYVMMEQFSNVLMDIEVLDVRETKGVSTNMEREGLERTLLRLMKEVDIAEVTTDASSAIMNRLKEMKKDNPELKKLFHSLDIWHKSKSLSKALNKVRFLGNFFKSSVSHFEINTIWN